MKKLNNLFIASGLIFTSLFIFSCKPGLGYTDFKEETVVPSIETPEPETTVSGNTKSEETTDNDLCRLTVKAANKSYARTVLPSKYDLENDTSISFVLSGNSTSQELPEDAQIFVKKWIYENGKSAFENMKNSTDVRVRRAIWDFELSVYKGDTLIFYNTLVNVDTRESTVTLNFGTLNDMGFGKGSVTYRLYFPQNADLSEVKYVIVKTTESGFSPDTAFATAPEAEILLDEEKSQKFVEVTGTDLNSGYYRIYFRIYNSLGVKTGTWQETMLVAANNNSQKTTAIPVLDTYHHIAYIHSEKINGVFSSIDEDKVIENFNTVVDAYLSKDMFTNPYYTVEGFYDNADFTGTPVTKIAANTKNDDVTLYVKWTLKDAESFTLAEQAIIQGAETSNDIFCTTGFYHYENGVCKYFQMLPSFDTLSIPCGTKMETVNFSSEACRIISLGDGSEIEYLKIPDGISYSVSTAPNAKIKTLELDGTFYPGSEGRFFSGLEVEVIKATSSYVNTYTVSSYSYFKGLKKEFSFEYTDEAVTVGKGVFNESKIKEITIPGTVKTISDSAFYGLSNLSKITFEENSQLETIGEAAFGHLDQLTEIEIPAGVTKISARAFYEDTGLEKVIINPSSVTVGNGIFTNCTGLDIYAYYGVLDYRAMSSCESFTLHILDEPEKIGAFVFYNMTGLAKIILPDSITSIGINAFQDCSSLTEISLPSKVTSLPDNVFEGCSSLTKVEGLNKITTMGESVFSGCAALKEVNLSKDLTTIETKTFLNCAGLEKIYISANVTTIGTDAFKGCSGIKELSVESFDSYKEIAFGNAYSNPVIFTDSIFQDKTEITEYTVPEEEEVNFYLVFCWNNLKKVYLPASLNTFNNSAFSNSGMEFVLKSFDTYKLIKHVDCESWSVDLSSCTSSAEIADSFFKENTKLKGVKLPEEVTVIPASCFEGCSTLEYCYAPGASSVKKSAFLSCRKLKTIEFSELKEIGASAFDGCYSLKEIYAPSITSLGAGAFNNLGKIKITMPLSLLGKGILTGSEEIELVLTGTETEVARSQFNVGSSSDTNYLMVSSLTLPESVTKIGDLAFNWWFGLKKLYLGDSVTSVGSYAFRDTRINELYLGKSLVSVGDFAFSYCNLAELDLPLTLTTLGNKSFNKRTIVSEPEDIPVKVKAGIDFLTKCKGDTNKLNSAITGSYSIEIKDFPETLPASLFKNCTGLLSVEIPETVNTIGESVCQGCTALTSINLPSGIDKISNKSFYGCTSLESIDIPENVTKIWDDAFNGCSNLKEVTFHGEKLTYIYDGAFSNCSPDLDLVYPASVIYAPYKIKYMLDNLDGEGYSLYQEEEHKAEKITVRVTPNSSYAPSEGKVTETSKYRNGSDAVVYFYYNRSTVTITFDFQGGSTTTELIDGNKLIGKAGAPLPEIATPTIEVEPGERQLICIGYNDYNNWLPSSFPDKDTTYTVIWGDRDPPAAPGNFRVSASKDDSGNVVTASWTLPSDDDILAFKVVVARPGGAVLTYSVDNPKATSTTISGVNVNSASGTYTFYCYAVDTSRNKGSISTKQTLNLTAPK